jgi:hypothetical protein
VMYLHVGGRRVGTTGEHPFWVRGKGWLQADQVVAGDHLVGHDDQWVVVDAVERTEEYQTVYNLRVADSHTYFVGCAEWGFSLWAHNDYGEFLKSLGLTDKESTPALRALYDNATAATASSGQFNKRDFAMQLRGVLSQENITVQNLSSAPFKAANVAEAQFNQTKLAAVRASIDPATLIATDHRQLQKNVNDQLVATTPANEKVGSQVKFEVTHKPTGKTHTVILDNTVVNPSNPQAGVKIVDSKWTGDASYTTASRAGLRGAQSPEQKPVFEWLSQVKAGTLSASDLEIVPIGPNARKAGFTVGKPVDSEMIQNHQVEFHVNDVAGRIVVRDYYQAK